MHEIPEDLRTELTASFLRNFQRVFFCWLAVECAVAIPFFAARKMAGFAVVAVALVLFIALPKRLLDCGHIRGAGWALAISGLVVVGAATVVSGGMRSPAMIHQLSLVVSATFLLGLRGTLILAIPLLSLDLGLAIYQASGAQLPVFFPAPPLSIWFAITGAFAMTGTNVHLAVVMLGNALAEHRGMFERLRELTTHQEEVREEERQRIAREIHDDLGQQLTAIKLRVAQLSRQMASADLTRTAAPASAQIEVLGVHLDDAIRTVRGIAYQLRPGVLDTLGLNAALEWLAREFEGGSGVPCRVELDAVQLDAATATAIFRVAQEAVTNVARHAHASAIWISLKKEAEDVVLTVRDNGHGLHPADLTKRGSFGLVGMRERAASKGGTLEIGPRPGGGTILQVRMPSANAVPV